MALSDEEKATLKRLQDKAKEPERPPPSIGYTLDLSDDKAYDRAKSLGLIEEPSSGDDGDGDGDGGNGEGDEPPKRRGYFPE